MNLIGKSFLLLFFKKEDFFFFEKKKQWHPLPGRVLRVGLHFALTPAIIQSQASFLARSAISEFYNLPVRSNLTPAPNWFAK